ncbi:hypothetical protein [Leptolyngbya sp. PCC 6406]|uniref:hypothetical protein n=1 Tax=Leptolyngbya sp. PCC 6406 TaxID=1173264 RepID=UPI0002ACC068|nr:hypothetical protein [Leptolyngbya sp. PCC 6406]
MAESPQASPPQSPRDNPFWSYRDPLTGRWLTVMTTKQWQQNLAQTAFQPKVRRSS